MVICLPVSRSYCVFMSSSAFFKLAAANTTRSRGCCAMPRPVGRSHARAARPTIAPSSDRRRARYDAICYAVSAFPAGTAISYRIDGPRAVGKGIAQRRTCRRFHRDLSKEMPHEAQRSQPARGQDCRSDQGSDDGACSHRYRRRGDRHFIDHQRGGGRPRPQGRRRCNGSHQGVGRDDRQVRRRSLFGLGAGALAALAWPSWRVDAKSFTDAAGRRVDVPDPVLRVFPAGPPASVTLYTVAPEKMLGWTQAPGAEARPFLPQRYAALPELGRLTGRGNTVNLENVVKLAPDLVLDVGNTTDTYVSLADRAQAQTPIPSALIAGRLADTAETLRTLGGLLDAQERAEALAGYAAAVIADAREQTAKIPPSGRPSIYIARGPNGLESAVAGSIGSEVVDLVGASNVVGKDTGPRTIVEISPEQILAWQPDVILTIDRRFHAAIRADPVWREVKAVQAGRIHFVPDLPFSWLDNPPAPNRLIGLLWLGKLLYPASLPQDIRGASRRVCGPFYHTATEAPQLDELLADPPA